MSKAREQVRPPRRLRPHIWPGAVFGVLLVTWLGSAIFLFPYGCKGISCWAQYGESFGAINALFAGLAFCGLVVGLRLQHVETLRQIEQFERLRSTEEKRFRVRMSLDLYFEFHQSEMQESMATLREVTQTLKSLKRPFGKRVWLGQDPNVHDKELRRINSIIQFFEKWALLKSTDYLDHELLGRLLGAYYVSVYDAVLRPLLTDPDNSVSDSRIVLINDQLNILVKEFRPDA